MFNNTHALLKTGQKLKSHVYHHIHGIGTSWTGRCDHIFARKIVDFPISEERKLKMATETLFCKFHQFGHCKFGQECQKPHPQQSCSTLQCKDKNCTFRHPKICKFFARRGWCKFGEECSFLHFSPTEHFTNKSEVESLKAEINELKTRQLLLEAKVLKIDTIEEELKILRTMPCD